MIAVITGDIINSRNEPANKWLSNLKKILASVNSTPKYWEIYRGDSFQLQTTPEAALLICIRIKASIKQINGLDVRLAIGIGEKNFDAERITESNGEVFINSGYAFDHLLKKQSIAIKSPWKAIDDEFNISIPLALLTMDYWTANSAEFVSVSIENPESTQKDLGNLLNISQAGISKRGKRSGFEEIIKFEQHYRQKIDEKINQP
ncbi:transcriptional regulator [Tenacibaculum sp. SZ-18]|uniref:SatD family protein n=1 Tax=Tenacibaculum sp. SZ-18 TaxID=754423 RepID=UPI000C2D5AE4|nr:SatD family protein [Tenacibaculum sp. SZ-18]AUC15193.1 transcriptional regulator [Tenacibaculum sp. SZ-18]